MDAQMDLDFLQPPVVFVHIGLLFYVLGFIMRDALVLRVLVLCGTVFYILYYYFVSADPLWDAILASAAIGLANIYSAIRIMLERSTFTMSQAQAQTYGHFSTLSPGQFRKLMRLAKDTTATKDTEMCREGETPARLYLILENAVQVEKNRVTFTVGTGNFIGELAFLLEEPASATVIAPAGTRFLSWETSQLRRLMGRSPELSNAMIALFNLDISRKLAVSSPDGGAASRFVS